MLTRGYSEESPANQHRLNTFPLRSWSDRLRCSVDFFTCVLSMLNAKGVWLAASHRVLEPNTKVGQDPSESLKVNEKNMALQEQRMELGQVCLWHLVTEICFPRFFVLAIVASTDFQLLLEWDGCLDRGLFCMVSRSFFKLICGWVPARIGYAGC